MIYFDNSATSFYKPYEVVKCMENTTRFLSANPGRGSHRLSLMAMRAVYSTRKSLARFLGFSQPERVIFTANCTHALNLAILGLNLTGKHVVTTALEHNSVLRTLYFLRQRGDISLSVAPVNPFGQVDSQAVISRISANTALVVVNHVSNVTGAISPIREIGKFCKGHGITFLVDGAQSVGHLLIDARQDCIDAIAVAPHKGLLGVMGVGALVLSDSVCLKPISFGGTGTSSLSLVQPTDFPEGFEAGTLNLPAITALGQAVRLAEKNMQLRQEKVMRLSLRLIEGLSGINAVNLYTHKTCTTGIISFAIRGLTSEQAAQILSDQYDVCVRGGLHCAPLLHKALGTLECGLVRASLSCANTEDEVDFFVEAIREICGKK